MKKQWIALALSMVVSVLPVSEAGMIQAAEAPSEETVQESVLEKEAGFSVCPVGDLADSDDESADEGQQEIYTVTISFDGNGGTGAMPDMTAASNAPASLAANAFARSGFTFIGWNTSSSGSGDSYADQADVSRLATAANNGDTITFYAQWKMESIKLKKAKPSKPGVVSVSYAKNSNATGYEIQCSRTSNFKNPVTKTAKKSTTKLSIQGLTPGKTYYVRVRCSNDKGGSTVYSDWSNVKKVKVKSGSTISNTKSEATIEADVTLKGSGTGYHAKLVVCTATSAVSFGIQYDSCAAAPYTGKTMALIENVSSNGTGGQQYTRVGNPLKQGKTYHMMLTIDKKGKGAVYIDYKKVGSFSNSGLAKQYLYLRVEGSARQNGDNVNATFSNIQCKTGGSFDPNRAWGTYEFQTNKTLKNKIKSNGTIKIYGQVSGLPAGGDWDSQYGNVSDIIQFQ